jgi:hypothetical protein
VKSDSRRRGSTTNSSNRDFYNKALGAQSSQDFLLGGSTTKSTGLINTFLEVLRVFTQHKFICFCLDDIHFADVESLELISRIVSARMEMVIILTYRPESMSPERIARIVEHSNAEVPG